MTALSQAEQAALVECEAEIEANLTGFMKVGAALLRSRDDRLYRDVYRTFEQYCRKRWKWGRNYVNKQIAAAQLVRNLGTNVPTPVSEAQARELVPLPVEQQREVAQLVNFEHVTARELKQIVQVK